MTTIPTLPHAGLRRAVAAALCAVTLGVAAHGASVGDIAIGHPFATPSIPGTSNGAAYLASIENNGAAADRLVRASTPIAARVEIHTMNLDAQGVMRMREIDGVKSFSESFDSLLQTIAERLGRVGERGAA